MSRKQFLRNATHRIPLSDFARMIAMAVVVVLAVILVFFSVRAGQGLALLRKILKRIVIRQDATRTPPVFSSISMDSKGVTNFQPEAQSTP